METKARDVEKWADTFGHHPEIRESPGSVLHPNEVSVPAAVSRKNLTASDRRAGYDQGRAGASKQQCHLCHGVRLLPVTGTKYMKKI